MRSMRQLFQDTRRYLVSTQMYLLEPKPDKAPLVREKNSTDTLNILRKSHSESIPVSCGIFVSDSIS